MRTSHKENYVSSVQGRTDPFFEERDRSAVLRSPFVLLRVNQVRDAHITERERVLHGAREIFKRKCLHGDHFGRCTPGRFPKFTQLSDRGPQGLGLDTGGNPAVAEAHGATQGVWRPTTDINRRSGWPRVEEDLLAIHFHDVLREAPVEYL